jgi:hypothetical protein
VCFTNSFDAAKTVKFEQYMVWVIDEVSPGDSNQLAYSSDNILKVLLDPGVGCTVNAKHGSIDIPACVPRIFTCNNSSPQDLGQQWRQEPPDDMAASTCSQEHLFLVVVASVQIELEGCGSNRRRSRAVQHRPVD